ncbi:HNH endonuclease [Mesorhizobium muleiense]|uniref:HNH endonuclease n=1 Tax=Mesorhizobium muleiense TaxID=1004279 RepID=UPI0011145D2E
MRIPPAERAHKFCSKCDAVTPWNTYDRCLVCQRQRSQAYAERKKASGGAFSQAVRTRLIAENPERCPKCLTLWSQVKPHAQHPNTPWHFDHHVSPQRGGTNADENARILCWPCNLEKLNS